MVLKFKDRDYDLSTSLRVAYVVQGQHNHKPYTEVFSKIGEMTIEQQIDIIYASFKCENPEAAKDISSANFRDWALDNLKIKEVMTIIKFIVTGIAGNDNDDDSDSALSLGDTGNI